jgi:hypothetical protein
MKLFLLNYASTRADRHGHYLGGYQRRLLASAKRVGIINFVLWDRTQ